MFWGKNPFYIPTRFEPQCFKTFLNILNTFWSRASVSHWIQFLVLRGLKGWWMGLPVLIDGIEVFRWKWKIRILLRLGKTGNLRSTEIVNKLISSNCWQREVSTMIFGHGIVNTLSQGINDNDDSLGRQWCPIALSLARNRPEYEHEPSSNCH